MSKKAYIISISILVPLSFLFCGMDLALGIHRAFQKDIAMAVLDIVMGIWLFIQGFRHSKELYAIWREYSRKHL